MSGEKVRKIFETHAKDGRIFSPGCVSVTSRESSGCYYGYEVRGIGQYVHYSCDGVVIECKQKMMTRLGDTDLFTETTVTIDGKHVHHSID